MARFVTVATFAEVPKAEIAKSILEEAGIRAYLSDSELVAMDWLIANAIGGVKVQVAEADAERALAALAEAKDHDANLIDEQLDEEELTRQAMAEAPEDDAEASAVTESAGEATPAENAEPRTHETEEITDRDRNAKRAFVFGWFAISLAVFAAFTFPSFGLAVPFLGIVALYFFIASAFGTGTLTSSGRFNLWVSSLLVVPAVIIAAWITSFMLR